MAAQDEQRDKMRLFLTAAVFCERAIEDTEGFFTLVRIFDSLHVRFAENEPLPSQDQPLPLVLTLFLSVRREGSDAASPLLIPIQTVNPSGERKDQPSLEVIFPEKKMGLNINMQLHMYIRQPGPHWMDLFFEDRLLTRLALDVRFEQSPTDEEPPTGGLMAHPPPGE